jgi:hypothetical protein
MPVIGGRKTMKSTEIVNVPEIQKMESLVLNFKTLTSNDECAQVNSLDMEAKKLQKEIEARRKEAKEPFQTMGERIDAACKPLTERLSAVMKLTGDMLFKYKREMEAKAEEHRREQEAERKRIEEENQRKIDEQKAIERQREIERRRTGEIKTPAPAPVVLQSAPIVTEVIVPVSTIKTRKIKKVRITDPAKVPAYWSSIMLRPINETAVKDALISGAVIHGAELYEEEVPVR